MLPDFVVWILMIGVLHYCIERASRETTPKLRFHRMLPAIVMMIGLGVQAYF